MAEPIPDPTPPVDPASPVPLYHQLFLHYAGAIQAGTIRAGEYLPAERDIAERFGVGRITATRAVRELALAGMVSREQGRGTRVNFIAEAVVQRGPRGDGIAPVGTATAYDVVLHAFAEVPPPPGVAAVLGADGPVQRSVRVLRFAGRPYAHLTACVPAALGRHWTRAALATRPLSELIAAAGHPIARSEEHVSALLADAELAGLLEVAPGSPLLEVVRTGSDADGRAVEHLLGRYVPDRYRYSVVSR